MATRRFLMSCPETADVIETGFRGDLSTWKRVRDFKLLDGKRFRCSSCGERHAFRADRAWREGRA